MAPQTEIFSERPLADARARTCLRCLRLQKPQLLNLTYRSLNSLPFSRVHCTLCRGTGGGGADRPAGTAVPDLHSVDISSPVTVAPRAPPNPHSPFPYLFSQAFMSSATSRSVPLFILRSTPPCFWQIHLISGAFQPCSDSAARLRN